MNVTYYTNYLETEDGKIELTVADNMCSTFVYPEFLLKHYSEFAHIDDKEVFDILDVGCGAGPFCVFWGRRGKKVDGIDINPIAIDCCRQNIEKYSLSEKVHVIEIGIEFYSSDDKYDLIVCNPPIGDDSYMRKGLSSEYERINNKIANNDIDAEVEDFLTNCWKDASGKDLIDYIFIRAGSLLKQNGKILFICGDDSVEGDKFICSKVLNNASFSVLFNHKFTEHLRLEDSGEVYECDKNYNILVFEYLGGAENNNNYLLQS